MRPRALNPLRLVILVAPQEIDRLVILGAPQEIDPAGDPQEIDRLVILGCSAGDQSGWILGCSLDRF